MNFWPLLFLIFTFENWELFFYSYYTNFELFAEQLLQLHYIYDFQVIAYLDSNSFLSVIFLT